MNRKTCLTLLYSPKVVSDPTLQSHRFRPAGNMHGGDRRRRFDDDLAGTEYFESRCAAADRIDRIARLQQDEVGAVSGRDAIAIQLQDLCRVDGDRVKTRAH